MKLETGSASNEPEKRKVAVDSPPYSPRNGERRVRVCARETRNGDGNIKGENESHYWRLERGHAHRKNLFLGFPPTIGGWP